MAHLQLMDAIQGGTFSKYMHELQERGHVGLAHEGLLIEADVSRHGLTGKCRWSDLISKLMSAYGTWDPLGMRHPRSNYAKL